jgi:glutamate formiminotransferase
MLIDKSKNEYLIECVPNVSEGRNLQTLDKLSDLLVKGGVTLLHRDIGSDAHRTVFTLIGTPTNLSNTLPAFIEEAIGLIDLRHHQGAHPRIGAVDVCPLIPLFGTPKDIVESVVSSVGSVVGESMGVPVFLYEESARSKICRSLSEIRKGGLQKLRERMCSGEVTPSYGPNLPHESAGAMVLGQRPFLIAWNISLSPLNSNLDPLQQLKRAKKLASQIREGGSVGLSRVRAIGWDMPTYGNVQVSCNLLDFRVTGLKQVFDTITQLAPSEDMKVNGSELIGLLPLEALVDGFSGTTEQKINKAIQYLGLSLHSEFSPTDRIIEWRKEVKKLVGVPNLATL